MHARYWLAAALILSACSSPAPDPGAAARSIDADRILEHIRTLASDEFEGRLPGSKGEELTVAYLTGQFQQLGLAPGNPDGTYEQSTPLVSRASAFEGRILAGGRELPLTPSDDYVAVSRRITDAIEVSDSDVVFVGYGVVAPEYDWDDYKGLDVAGKTIVMLVNDPAVPDPDDPSRLDDALFKGRAMTYYGRWTYKYEIAAEKGAAAAIIVHETGPAGYPWEVVRNSWGGENFDIQAADNNMGAAPVEAWITTDKARELFAACGLDFEQLKTAATHRNFNPVDLGAKASFEIGNTIRRVDSRNVVAKLVGSESPDEYVIYTAHWDHLGKDSSVEGDQIYNGALDNASGTAILLELARAFKALPAPPKRSILFAAVTAEEQGLLGAKWYAENPLYPLEKTLAVINMDGFNPWGRTSDLVVVGLGASTLDDVAAEVAGEQGRTLKPDAEPEKGYYYRSDHFEFAKKGVPAFYSDAGVEFVGKDPSYGEQKRRDYTADDYHKVSDEVKPDWDLAGAVEDARLLFELGYRVAQNDQWPSWKEGSEFKAIREQMLGGR